MNKKLIFSFFILTYSCSIFAAPLQEEFINLLMPKGPTDEKTAIISEITGKKPGLIRGIRDLLGQIDQNANKESIHLCLKNLYILFNSLPPATKKETAYESGSHHDPYEIDVPIEPNYSINLGIANLIRHLDHMFACFEIGLSAEETEQAWQNHVTADYIRATREFANVQSELKR